MTDATSGNPYGTPTTSGPQPTMSRQRTVDKAVRTLLRTPGLSKLIGSRLLTLRLVGRKTGKHYEIPVAYTRHGDHLLIGTRQWPWVKNVKPGTPIDVSMGGKPQPYDPIVHTGEAEVMRLFEIVAKDNRKNAEFNGIGYNADGTPNKADLYQTWKQGGVVIELTPR
ncbi:nitroreductase/quinone reductase family protein [Nocardia sp. NPDC052566]|uniref:nitroreductase/quinone reductase family protein n=1 Tax=Nocardia sp. NPDC052566 TaxID=3364330 RepID=UPI0037CAE217